MFLGTLVSRILGFVKSPFLMGAVVGLNSSVAGSWDIANKLPNLLYMVIAGGLSMPYSSGDRAGHEGIEGFRPKTSSTNFSR